MKKIRKLLIMAFSLLPGEKAKKFFILMTQISIISFTIYCAMSVLSNFSHNPDIISNKMDVYLKTGGSLICIFFFISCYYFIDQSGNLND